MVDGTETECEAAYVCYHKQCAEEKRRSDKSFRRCYFQCLYYKIDDEEGEFRKGVRKVYKWCRDEKRAPDAPLGKVLKCALNKVKKDACRWYFREQKPHRQSSEMSPDPKQAGMRVAGSSCDSLKAVKACNRKPECEFDEGAGQCAVDASIPCMTLFREDSCAARKDCSWGAGRRIPCREIELVDGELPICNSIAEEADCAKRPDCKFHRKIAKCRLDKKVACESIYFESSCVRRSDCGWNESQAVPCQGVNAFALQLTRLTSASAP